MAEEEHGKTSSAKILARAINCLNPQNGEPCNQCEICRAILSGSLTDVVEMDAASNNSVEDIRLIRDEVNFLPTLAKYRIYIIDEVHMLSTGAFNALLKTLEEPPEHVKFILATTEPQKLPATILSRCQRFDFKQLSEEDIMKRLKIICKESNISITDEALHLIAVLSEGAMRDSISILERCSQEGTGEISENEIRELVGMPELTYIHNMVKGILEYQVEEVIQTSQQVLNEGKDLNYFLWEIIKYIKDILVWKTTNHLEIYREEEIEKIKKLAEEVSKERLLKLIYSLSELENTIKWSSQKQILFQVGMIKACNKEENQGWEEWENRIRRLEERIQTGIRIETAQPKIEMPEKKEEKKKEKIIEKKQNIANTKKVENWSDVLNTLKTSGKMVLYTNLLNTTAKEINDMTIGIVFHTQPTAFGKTVLEQIDNRKELEKIVSLAYGKEMQIKYITEENNTETKTEENNMDQLVNTLDIPINVIEE